jgi:hypothetical protein
MTTMTNDDAIELQKVIVAARRVHDRETGPADGTAMICGALIKAVELLAKNAGLNPTPSESLGHKPATNALAARLAGVLRMNCKPDGAGDIQWLNMALAGLHELAANPCELPSAREIETVISSHMGRSGDAVFEMLRMRLGPIIVARNAERDALQARVAELEGVQHVHNESIGFHAEIQKHATEMMHERGRALARLASKSAELTRAQERIAALEQQLASGK